ncbi:MAG: ATP-binding cassette domain-containing protein [Bacillota bacterium]|nr:ATP-binding cassette domain-containing protein [Bacillota bacterium]
MLEVKDVYFGYQPRNPVLQGLSLTVREGDWLTVLGKNGCGKTTLALLLNGLLLPDRGQVLVDDMPTHDQGALGKIRRTVGFVFQNPDNQLVGATVEEDVAFGPCNLGLPRQAVRKRVESCLELLGLTDYRDHSPHMLSGGQKQKVALAGALAMEPKYIVLDEACSMLDPASRENLWQAVSELRKNLGITIISISHFPEEALLGNGILLLDNGRSEAELWL